jgi:hypothetical protein
MGSPYNQGYEAEQCKEDEGVQEDHLNAFPNPEKGDPDLRFYDSQSGCLPRPAIDADATEDMINRT